MKKKISLLLGIVFLSAMRILAQVPYYGSPFYKEGFDYAKNTLPTRGWVQSGVSYNVSMMGTHTDSAFTTTNAYSPTGKNFANADLASTYSLLCAIRANTGLIDTLTSPVIVNTDTNFLCVGFSIFDPATSFPLGYGYMSFQVSKDNGVTWNEAWRTDGAPTGFNYVETAIPITFAGWKNVRINLDASYKSQNLKVRFCINSPAARETPRQPMNLLIDGVFISPLRTTDATLKAVNNFSLTANNDSAYLQTPIKLKIVNSGTNPISSINLGYKVTASGLPDQLINETYNLTTPLLFNDTATYTFLTQANLSSIGVTYTIKAWSALAGEQYTKDDSLSFTLINTTIAVTGVQLNHNSASINVGDISTLIATIIPSDATNKKITWKSRNTPVATVDTVGKVTAVAVGSTYIIATTQDDGFSDSCLVTVTTTGTEIKEAVSKKVSFAVFPNPTTGKLKVKDKNLEVGANINIYNNVGICVDIISTNQGEIDIDISHLPSGIYFIGIGNERMKIVKQ